MANVLEDMLTEGGGRLMSNVLEETGVRGLLVGPEPYLASCARCGARLPMPEMPMKMSAFIGMLKSALNEHAVCGRECAEHRDDGSDPIAQQHHSPEDHVGQGPCRCDLYTAALA